MTFQVLFAVGLVQLLFFLPNLGGVLRQGSGAGLPALSAVPPTWFFGLYQQLSGSGTDASAALARIAVNGSDHERKPLLAFSPHNSGEEPLVYQPGARWLYGFGHDVQAALVEHFSGMPLDRFLEQRLFGPLRMADSGYAMGRDNPGRVARLHRETEYPRLRTGAASVSLRLVPAVSNYRPALDTVPSAPPIASS